MTAWWRRRTLHTRLSLLVTGAVAAAVVAMAVTSWLVVEEIQQRRMQSALTADAAAIAAQPDQWLVPPPGPGTGPGPGGERRDRFGRHGPRQLGPRWQILDARATVISSAASPLPVTPRARTVAAGGTRMAQEEVAVGRQTYRMLTVPVAGGGAVQVALD